MGFFWRFWAVRHFSRANCAETSWDRHRQAAYRVFIPGHPFPAYEIFSIKRKFWRSKSRFSTFKETCAQGHQRAVPP